MITILPSDWSSCDAHNSEYLAEVDARREALSGFTGSAGTAVVTQSQVGCRWSRELP